MFVAKYLHKSEQGFSIIEIMIGVGLFSIIMLAMAGQLQSLNNETARLNAKSSLFDIERLLRANLSNSGKCTYSFGSESFDSTSIPTVTPALPTSLVTINTIREGTSTTAPVLLEVGQNPQGINQVTVQAIKLMNWVRLDVNWFRADVVVEFQSLVGPIAPVRIIGLDIRTDPASPASNKAISGCSMASSTCESIGGQVDPGSGQCRGYTGQVAKLVVYGGMATAPTETIADGPTDSTVLIQWGVDATTPLPATAESDVFVVRRNFSCAAGPNCTAAFCNSDRGWHLSGCHLAAAGQDNDILPYDQGCASQAFYNQPSVTMSVYCVKNLE